MEPDMLDAYARASDWTADKVEGAVTQLDARTPCEEWDARTLMNHMLETERFFLHRARGEDASPPSPDPPALLGDDPVADFRTARAELLGAFGEPGVMEQSGPALGIAFCDQLLHGWDLAVATGQDATMPDGLPEVAYDMLSPRLTDEQRGSAFKPRIPIADDASAQERLLAFTGRQPDAGESRH
jgi:uncharacterized protein (TIGR03086 family)